LALRWSDFYFGRTVDKVTVERAIVAVHPVTDLVVLAFAEGGLFWLAKTIAHVIWRSSRRWI